jgi:hypothetical protein
MGLTGDLGSDAARSAGDEHDAAVKFQPRCAEHASRYGQCPCSTDSYGPEGSGGFFDHDHSPMSLAMIIFMTSLVPP